MDRSPFRLIVLVWFVLLGLPAESVLCQDPDSLHYQRIYAHRNAQAYDAMLVSADSLIANGRTASNLLLQADGHWFKGYAFRGKEQYAESREALQAARQLFAALKNEKKHALTLNEIGVGYDYQSMYDSALVYYNLALESFKEQEDTYWVATALNNIGIVNDLQGHYDQAVAYYSEGLALREEIGDSLGIASSLNNLGIVNRIQGRHDEALIFYKRALAIREALGNKQHIATSLNNIGVLLDKEGRYEEAISYHERSLAIKEELGNRRGIASSMLNIGTIYHKQGKYEDALSLYGRAVTIDSTQGNKHGLGLVKQAQGVAYKAKGDYDKALTHFFESLALREEINDQKGIGHVSLNIGSLYYALGDHDEALEFLERARRVNESIGYKDGIATVHNNLGNVYRDEEAYDLALAQYEQALHLREEIGDQKGISSTLANIGRLYVVQNDYASAIGQFEQALEIDKKLGDAGSLADRLRSIGSTYMAIERFDEALAHTEDALFIADSIKALPLLRDIYELRAEIFERAGNTGDALHAYKAYKATHDSLFNTDSQSVIAELQTRYRAQEQEQQIDNFRRQREIQQLWMFGLVGGVVLFGAVAFLGYNGYRIKKRALSDLNVVHEQLKSTQTQLIQQEKLASLGQLTAGIAHEIQNPLNFVNNFSELNEELIEEIEEKPEASVNEIKELIEMIKLNSEKIKMHGSRAGKVLRSMAQHASWKPGERESVGINAFVGEYLTVTERRIEVEHPDLDLQVERRFDERAGSVEMVPQEIGQVLVNLFSNAMDAMIEQKTLHDGAYTPKLVVSSHRKNGSVEVHIADNGAGIPAGGVDRIFDPFYTTKPTGQGTGLGLSLSYEIITQGHGGHLSVESHEGDGATFIMSLPIA